MYRAYVHVLFVISLVMFLLSLVSFALVDPGTATYGIVAMNLIGLGGFVVVSGAVLYRCRDTEGR